MSQELTTSTAGQRRPATDASSFSALSFVIRQYLAGVRTAMPVIVRDVTPGEEGDPVGTVDVEPLVAQLDGANNVVSHGVIYGIPYFRIQGGINAIIMDPEVGDIGLAVVADRDVSNVKSTQKVSAPGSKRRNHFSDGFYFGGFLNANPKQYIQFATDGINIVSPTAVNIQAPDIKLKGRVTQDGGDASFGGDVTVAGEVTGNNVKLSGHGHDGVEPGGGQSGGPVNLE